MLLDLVSSDNYVSYNITLAKTLGLISAIYINEVIVINNKAVKKKKMDKQFFTLDRKYLTKRTTLTESEQLTAENNLIKLGLLSRSEIDPNKIAINIEALVSLMLASDEHLLKDISSLIDKKENKKTKQEAIIENLKNNIKTNNAELRGAFFDWIDSVIAKEGKMTKAAVTIGEKKVNEFSIVNINGQQLHSLDIALKVLEIASVSGYRDIDWAISKISDAEKRNLITKFTSCKNIISAEMEIKEY